MNRNQVRVELDLGLPVETYTERTVRKFIDWSVQLGNEDPLTKDYRIIVCADCEKNVGYQHIEYEELKLCSERCVGICENIIKAVKPSSESEDKKKLDLSTQFWAKMKDIDSKNSIKELCASFKRQLKTMECKEDLSETTSSSSDRWTSTLDQSSRFVVKSDDNSTRSFNTTSSEWYIPGSSHVSSSIDSEDKLPKFEDARAVKRTELPPRCECPCCFH